MRQDPAKVLAQSCTDFAGESARLIQTARELFRVPGQPEGFQLLRPPQRILAHQHEVARFHWREAVWHLRAPVLRALFQQLSDPGRLQPLGLVEVLDWTAAALDRVDRAAFFSQFNEGEAVPYFYEPFLEAFDPDLRKPIGRLVHAGGGGALHGRPRGQGTEGRSWHRGRSRAR